MAFLLVAGGFFGDGAVGFCLPFCCAHGLDFYWLVKVFRSA